MPESVTVRPNVVRTRYFQPASRARRRPDDATSRADAPVVASMSTHDTPRLGLRGRARSAAQKQVEAQVVEAVTPGPR